MRRSTIRGMGLPAWLLAGLFLLFSAPVAAQQQPRFVDKGPGEEEQIRKRREWFLESRTAGLAPGEEAWSKRLAAVEATRQALDAQRARQATGFEAEQNVWYSAGPSPSAFGGWSFGSVTGRVQAIAADWAGGVLYVGAGSGGVWKSTNDGLSWTSLFDSAGTLAIGAIEIDPADPDVLWVGTGDNVSSCESYFGIGLLRSADGGLNWETRNGSGGSTLEDLSSFASISIDPRDSNKLVVGGSYRGCSSGVQQEGGIHTTADGGLTWTNRLAGKEIHEIARDPTLPDRLWASSNRGVYKSVDNGVTWVLQTASGLPNGFLSRTELAVAPGAPDTVYVLYNTPSDQFWRTTDGGSSWTLMNPDACDGQCWYNMVIRVDPNDPDVIYRGTVRIFKSEDGGSSWTTLTDSWGASQQVHQDTHSLLVHPTAPDTFYVGSDGGLWKSVNGGSTFTNRNGNLNITQFYAIAVDANDAGRICGGAQDNSSLATDNDLTWYLQAVTGDGFVCQIDPQDDQRNYITSYPSGGYPNVWRSVSGLFGSFEDVTGPGSGIIADDRINWVTPYLLDPTSPNVLFLGTHRAYRSVDYGSSWTQVGPTDLTNSGSSTLKTLEINRSYPTHVYSGATSGAVYRSIDGGTSWTDITAGLPNRSINDLGADPNDPERLFAVVGGFNAPHVWEWNAGSGWTARDTGIPNVPANSVLLLAADDILVGTDTGIFRSLDGGLTFLPYMTGLPQGLVVTDLKFNAEQSIVTAGTYGRGVFQVEVGAVQPILLDESVEQPLVEIDGDGDDKIEPGETWSVRPILRNVGGLAAANVEARLSIPTPGVTLLAPDVGSFGNLAPGVPVPVGTGFRFVVDPGFECGSPIVFDLLDISSTTEPLAFPDRTGIHAALVQGGNADPVVTALFDENVDPDPGWGHEAVDPGLGCELSTYVDQWTVASKDAQHGLSYHLGQGPGGSYSLTNYAWLYPAGKDSEAGAGIVIPDEAIGATLTVVHWYQTAHGGDGGQVALDFTEDDQDVYARLDPLGGYPGPIVTGFCNGLEGQEAYNGSSPGWITSLFDLMPYKGGRIWPAFVFGADRKPATGEGWYIDEVRVEIQTLGAPTCDVARWPGSVASAYFELVAPGIIAATWDDSCNLAEFPEQTYAIEAGDLDTLVAGGGYTHTPVGGACDHLSPATFPHGAGNEYYLLVPTGEGRQGGAGLDSDGAVRPETSSVCGVRRVGCP